MMEIIKNGVSTVAPAPIVYDVTLNPTSISAERNGNVKLVRQTGPDKWSIQAEWQFGTTEECYAWFNYLRGLTKVYFDIKFPAPTGNIERAEFYISPISAKMLNMSRGAAGMWKTIKCNFVEV